MYAGTVWCHGLGRPGCVDGMMEGVLAVVGLVLWYIVICMPLSNLDYNLYNSTRIQ